MEKRRRRGLSLWFVLWMAGTIGAGAGFAFGGWGNGQAVEWDGEANMTCGDITGQVGAPWADFTTTGEGTASMSTTGDVGVKWNPDSEPYVGQLQPVPCMWSPGPSHYYYRTGGQGDPATVSVDITTSGSIGGTAAPWNPNNLAYPFSWNWHGVVSQEDPIWQWWDWNEGWSEQFHIEEGDKTADTNGNVDGGHTGTAGACAGGVQGGFFQASFQIPAEAWKFSIYLYFTTINNAATAVNTDVVTENFLKMPFTFETSISD